MHPSTDILCLAYKIGDAPTKIWHPRLPQVGWEESPWPQDLVDAINDGWLVEAHNRFFEYCIWTHILMPFHGFPEIPEMSWRCSAAKASYYNLPRDLEGCVAALGLPITKDMEGSKIMKKISKPRKPLKAERLALRDKGLDPDTVLLWHESPELYARNEIYCMRDVDAEHAFSEYLPDLPPMELEIWRMDQRMNIRGVRCDVELATSALALRQGEITLLNAELNDITGGEVPTGSSRDKAKTWLADQGLDLPDTTGETLDEFLKQKDLKPTVHRTLKIIREVNRTSTAKYDAMLERIDPSDHRMRDLMMYHGAGTGRWTGKGVQPHNFPRGNTKNMDLLCEVLLTMDRSYIRAMYGDVMVALSDALRGALVASKNRELIVADFAAIEARVVFWLARDEQALGVFEKGEDIYCDLASGIYGYPVHKKTHPNERQFGKQGILGLGFEMGFVTFLLQGCRGYDIHFSEDQARSIVPVLDWSDYEEQVTRYLAGDKRRRARLYEEGEDPDKILHELILMKYTVDTYRGRYPNVVQMWRDQEQAAIQAIKSPGREVECHRGRNTWVVEDRFLVTYLPSGKPLFYADPRIMQKKAPWKDRQGNPVFKETITFMGQPDKGKGWVRKDTYGGKLVENITQATARDLMAQAMVRADQTREYDVILSVHDELICEVDPGVGSVREFEKLMAQTPGWAQGCPVDAEGWRGFRYRK